VLRVASFTNYETNNPRGSFDPCRGNLLLARQLCAGRGIDPGQQSSRTEFLRRVERSAVRVRAADQFRQLRRPAIHFRRQQLHQPVARRHPVVADAFRRGRHGRTATWRASMANCETSCWTAKSLTPSWRRRCSSVAGGRPTTPSARTARWGTDPRPRSRAAPVRSVRLRLTKRTGAIPWQVYPGDRHWFHSWGQVNSEKAVCPQRASSDGHGQPRAAAMDSHRLETCATWGARAAHGRQPAALRPVGFHGARYAGGSGSPRFSTAARVVMNTHSSPSLSLTM